ncbi:MAG: nucleoside monophosphate kinase [Patescibacteria group bacterium]
MKLSKKNPLIIILLGKSGSGKGTQADLLVEKFKLDYIGSGDLLRNRAKKNDFVGKRIAQILSEGDLIPLPAIFKLWMDETEKIINKNKNFRGMVMDGNPRRIMEAYLIDDVFKFYRWDKNVKVFLVDISDKEAIWRLTNRRICKKCKEIVPFTKEFRNIKVCPQCGGELEKRSDDTISSVKKRLAWFRKDVQPIVNYYKKAGKLVKIDGEQSIENVFKDILKALK